MTTAATDAIYTNGLYQHARAVRDDSGQIFWLCPERASFEDDEDTTTYVCRGGEWFVDIIVNHYRRVHASPLDLWTAVAEFQPEPLQDPDLPMSQDQLVLLPSIAYLRQHVFGSSWSDTPKLV